MKQLRLGVVGCGDIAGYMALFSRITPQVRLAACCDVDAGRAQAFARRHRIPQVYTDYQALLGSGSVQAVYLAVPHHLHFAMLAQAVEARLPALVEKPLTRTLEEGQRLAEMVGAGRPAAPGAGRQAAHSAGHQVKVGVNYQYRYDRGCYALARAVQAGALGKVHSVRINVPWRRTRAYFDGSPWHKTFDQAGGGTLITQGSHFLDIALWALGEGPRSAAGYTASLPAFDVEVETLAHAVLETEGGALISLTSSMTAPVEGAVTIEMYGERGAAAYRSLPLPSVKFSGVRVRQERPPGRGLHALQRSLGAFAAWVLHDQPYLTPIHEALPALAAVEAIYRSSRRITWTQNPKS